MSSGTSYKSGRKFTPSQIINMEYHGDKNFMTPSVMRFGYIREFDIAFELSTGEGIMRGTTLYGVTVVQIDYRDNSVTIPDKASQCFHSLTEAEDHIENLKKKYGVPK